MAGQTDQVLNAVLFSIDRGTLNPGDIIEEAPLMETYGVSRTPVRECFIHLEAAGLIRRLPRKGAVLFKPTLEEFLAIVEVRAGKRRRVPREVCARDAWPPRAARSLPRAIRSPRTMG